MFRVLNYPQTVVEQFNTQSAKSQNKKKHMRNYFLKKYFLSNFWCVVTVHLTSCHIYGEQQTCFRNAKGNVEEKEKKKGRWVRGILLLKQILLLSVWTTSSQSKFSRQMETEQMSKWILFIWGAGRRCGSPATWVMF